MPELWLLKSKKLPGLICINYLLNGSLPEDKIEAKKMSKKVFNYMIVNEKLYRKLFIGPLLHCLTPSKAIKLMEKIHERVCGNYLRGRSLAHKALFIGYFWPYMMTEAQKFVQRCDKCQRFTPISHRPIDPLHSITPWPFTRWSLDLIGELLRSQ